MKNRIREKKAGATMATYSAMVEFNVRADISRRDFTNLVCTIETWAILAALNALEAILRSSVASNVDIAARLASPATFVIPSEIRAVVLTDWTNPFPTLATLPAMLPKSLMADAVDLIIGMHWRRANERNPTTARTTVLEAHHGGAAWKMRVGVGPSGEPLLQWQGREG
jgi:hypothetical protein